MPPTFEFESDLQAAIVDALERCGCWVMVNRVVRHRRQPTGLGTGSPDLLVVIPTHGVLFVECKRDAASKPSPEQIAFHNRARLFGVRSIVVRSVAEVLAAVQAIRAGRAWPVSAPLPAPATTAAAPAPRSPSDATGGPPARPTRPRGRQGAATAKPKTSRTKTERAA